MAASGVGRGVGVRAGKRGVGLCTIKAASVLLGVKGMIMQTNGVTGGGRERHMKMARKTKEKKNNEWIL